ncbi:uncharacterized protein LOC135703740 [Ochlerotatus camptorhynchus]|uniref:uncharacterized protein LOC135703740 n=1 Tax=Ochlerotatus camptorhynchus TaxID=644619 RepID=UPI0031DD2136
MAHHSTVDDIEDEIGSWGFSTSVSNYERSVQAADNRMPQPPNVGGRGRGIINPHHMASVRLASEISDLKCHSFPMGHLPTSKELLAGTSENEITPLLRQLGLNSREDEIHSKTTRKTVTTNDEIRLDGNVPVILNADLFRHCEAEEDEGIGEPDTFNPEQPLHEQFSTIAELVVSEEDDIPVANTIPKKTKSKKTKSVDSSADSALTNSSTSSIQSKKGKKKKWRKMTAEELKPSEPDRGRYEEVYSVGVHDNTTRNFFTTRQLHGVTGIKGWSSHY